MNKFAQLLYSYSPYYFKHLFANLRGWQLRYLRYGEKTKHWIQLAEEREYWTTNQWNDWHETQLSKLIDKAQKTKYYKINNYNYKNIPILDKQALRKNNSDFVVESIKKFNLFKDYTSGTTGTPISIFLKRETIQLWYALVERRWRNWYGLSRKDKWAIFGGQTIINQKNSSPPYWIKNFSLNQIYFSVYHISSHTIKYYVKALVDFKPQYIYGYASSLYNIAYEAMQQGLVLPKVKIVLNNGEILTNQQKELISNAFQAPCRDTYGMSETVAAASECQYGKLHAWPETGIWEILDKKNNLVINRKVGKLISTGLINKDMPLLRYDTGDLIALDKDYNCKCSRTLPIITYIEGREDDCILTGDGRIIGRLDPVFKSNLNIKEAQIIQESIGLFIINVVPEKNYSIKDEKKIISELQKRIGDVKIEIEKFDAIPRDNTGKFKSVISKL